MVKYCISEEENSGDGFIGEFFDNEFFLGKSETTHFQSLEFKWQGEKPHEHINESEFSAIF